MTQRWMLTSKLYSLSSSSVGGYVIVIMIVIEVMSLFYITFFLLITFFFSRKFSFNRYIYCLKLCNIYIYKVYTLLLVLVSSDLALTIDAQFCSFKPFTSTNLFSRDLYFSSAIVSSRDFSLAYVLVYHV